MSNVVSDDDQRNDPNSENHRFEAEDGLNPISRGRKYYYCLSLEMEKKGHVMYRKSIG